MSGEKRYPWREAMPTALLLKERLASVCERIEIAGSLRREKPDVGDIELLCIPKPSDSLFFTDLLDAMLKGLLGAEPPLLSYRPNIKGSVIYGQKNKLLIHVQSGIPVDIFSTDAKNFGMAWLVRTGSAEFNIRVMARFKELRMHGHAYGGITGTQGQEIDCPTEEVVFKHLGWGFIEPKDRI